MIKLENITKAYQMGDRELQVLKGVNINVENGEMVAIMGPSGSGKSTMLNIIGCLDRPTSGQYYLDGTEVSQMKTDELAGVRGHKIGFIFQSFNLLPQLSALRNVELGMRYSGKSDVKAATEALSIVGLGERMHHRPSELSGGEQQRVAIARALAKNPPLILADEPTGNLDSHSGAEVMSILNKLHTERGLTLVIITHDPGVGRQCHRIIRIMDGQIVKEEEHEKVA